MSKSEKQSGDWSNLSNLWQEAPEPDMAELVKKIKTKTFRMKAIFIFEVLVGIAAIILCLFAVFFKEEAISMVIGSVGVALSLLAIYFTWWVRKDIWEANSSSQNDQLKLLIKRSKAGVKYATFNLWGCLIGVAFVGLVFFLDFKGEINANAEKQGFLIFFLIGFAIYLIGVLVGSVIYLNKNKSEGVVYRKLLSDLNEEEKENEDPLT